MTRWTGASAIILLGIVTLTGCGITPTASESGHAHRAPTTSGPQGSKKSGRRAPPRGHFDPDSLDMISTSVGWAWNQETVWWTQDGGRHWSLETPTPLPRGSTLSVRVVSKNVAWVAVANNLNQTPPFLAWVTMTHGTYWKKTKALPHNDGISFISADSAQVAWMATDMVGASGTESMVIDATTNGGVTWTMLPSSITSKMVQEPHTHPQSAHPIPLAGDKSGMAFASPQEGFITGGQTGQTEEVAMLWQTLDGGTNWFRIPLQAGTQLTWTFPPKFFNAQDGLMAVAVNNVKLATYATDNGGRTWTSGSLLPFTPLGKPRWSFATMESGLYLGLTATTGGSVTGATLYKTTNGGHSWQRLSATQLPLRQVIALDDVSATTAFAVTQIRGRSVIWETQDGGQKWRHLRS